MIKKNKELMQALHVKGMCEKYPSFPKNYHFPYSKIDNSTNNLTKVIIDFINLTGGQAERISSTGRWIKDGEKAFDFYTGKQVSAGGKYIKSSGVKGTADISATIKGRSVKIEVKYGKDKMSPDQEKYQKSIQSAGGIYMIAKTFDTWLEDYIEIFGDDAINI